MLLKYTYNNRLVKNKFIKKIVWVNFGNACAFRHIHRRNETKNAVHLRSETLFMISLT